MIEKWIWLDRLIWRALDEDLGPGDLTTDALVDPGRKGRARLLAREDLVLAGMEVFLRVFQVLSSEITFEVCYRDGQRVPAGAEVCFLAGPVGVILKAERTALNLLQRMSGIATLTRRYVEKAGEGGVRVVDTRKTAPGMRGLDKYSVRMGGGFNHRMGLFDGILIKDNHIMAAGSIAGAVMSARKNCPHTLKVEVEVEDISGVEEALQAGADVILLDNMSPDTMREAVDLVAGRVPLEASGNITLENIRKVAETGVTLISVGALTHSPRAVDLSLELDPL